jgi:S1-C subfamily serine protease
MMRGFADRLETDLAALVEHVRPSMVRIEVDGVGTGSGTVWGNGVLVTNAHVAAQKPLLVETEAGHRLPARLVGVDRKYDLAVLEVKNESIDWSPMPLGDVISCKPGELVFSMGHPWGNQDGFTIGVLIGLEQRRLRGRNDSSEWIAASLHLRPGHSGGPMFDSRGRLLGLNTMMQGLDVGVAVPVYKVENFVRRIVRSI